LNVSGSFLDDFSVNFLIRATQASQSSSLITAPRLTLFNGQYAQLFIGTEIAYVSDLQPVVGTNTSAFAPTINTIPSGVQLLVQGTVSADRKYVTLTLQPRLATLVSLTPFTFQTTAGTNAGTPPANTTVVNTGPGNTTVTGTIQIPISEVETVSTTVSVPDGGTLLLGGQTAAGEAEREMGVPGLSKIPFLKRLFTNRSTAKDERIILILVKPTIIIQREAEQRQFPLLSTKVAG
jgi:general secretion pathway protein D